MAKRRDRHRVPRKDSEFDQYIRTTTDYLLGPAPGISLSQSLKMMAEGIEMEARGKEPIVMENPDEANINSIVQTMTEVILKHVQEGKTTLKEQILGMQYYSKFIPVRMTFHRDIARKVIGNLQKEYRAMNPTPEL